MSKTIKRLEDLQPDRRNANRGTERGRRAVENSLRNFGAGRSILVDKDGEVIAGNKTLEIAAELGLPIKVVPSDGNTLIVVQREDLDLDTDERARGLAIADNRSGELGLEWDAEELAGLLVDFESEELLQATGWSGDELDELLASISPVVEGGGGDDFDTTPDDGPTRTRRGDLWALGNHRLLVDDCTKHENVARLMDGRLAQLVYTDPPYGVDYDGGTKVREKLEGDHSADIYSSVLPVIAQFSDDQAPLYLWHAGLVSMPVLQALHANGYECRAQIIWNKNQAQFGALSAQYKQKHEPCWYAFKKGNTPYWYGPTNEVTVWDCDRANANDFHPTQKPVELAQRAIGNSSKRGGVVVDLFGGSGATLIACERLGRECRVMEIEPRYGDVILRRFEAETGEAPVLLERVSDDPMHKERPHAP